MTKDNPVAAGVAETWVAILTQLSESSFVAEGRAKVLLEIAEHLKYRKPPASPVQAGIDPPVAEMESWLLVKRDLYERPDHMGYTGIRDEAGRYTEEEAKLSVGDGQYGVSMVRLSEAPEFRKAAFHDLVIKHLTKQRDAAESLLAEAREALSRAALFLELDGSIEADAICRQIDASLSRLKPGEKGGGE